MNLRNRLFAARVMLVCAMIIIIIVAASVGDVATLLIGSVIGAGLLWLFGHASNH